MVRSILKSFSVSCLILLCTVMVQTAILSNISMLPALPDLALICVLYFSLHNGRLLGEATGFVSGLFLDFLSAAPFGLNCLFRTIIGFLGGLFHKTLNTEGILIPALLGFLATLLKAAMLWLISVMYPSGIMAYNPVSWMFLFELVLNSVLTPLMFKFLKLFSNLVLVKPEKMI